MLYVVATPIGNLGDISARALEVLEGCDIIAAEDTRHTQKLLTHFGIKKPLISYYEHNKASRTPVLLDKLRNGETVALVSDAGTPGISDPGEDLIKAAVREGLEVSMVPGPVAGITALVLSGLSTGKFVFEGFIGTDNKSKRDFCSMLASETRTVIIYEAPHRLLKTLELLEGVLEGVAEAAADGSAENMPENVAAGASEDILESVTESATESMSGGDNVDSKVKSTGCSIYCGSDSITKDQRVRHIRQIAVCRELTKAHEEIIRGTASELRKHFSENAPRGEFVIVIEGADPMVEHRLEAEAVSSEDIYLKTCSILKQSELSGTKLSRNEALKLAAKELGIPRNKAYAMYEEEKLRNQTT